MTSLQQLTNFRDDLRNPLWDTEKNRGQLFYSDRYQNQNDSNGFHGRNGDWNTYPDTTYYNDMSFCNRNDHASSSNCWKKNIRCFYCNRLGHVRTDCIYT